MAQNPEAALLIHYYFPPIHSIGVLRNFYIAQAFQKRIKTIKVLTTSNRNVLPQNNMKGLDTFDVTELKTKDYRSKRKQTHFKEAQKEKWTIKFGRKLIDSYPFNVWVGEGGSSYIRDGIKQGIDFLSKNPSAIIYSSFRPYADIYIGSKLKSSFPNAKWVVDFRDLHVDPMYKNVFFPSYQRGVDKKLLKQADLITTVSDGLAKELNKSLGHVETIYNGIVSRPFEIEKFKKFTISYTGSLFGNSRNPKPFLRYLNNQIEKGKITKENLAIKYAGKDGSKFKELIRQYDFEGQYEGLGMISHNKAKLLQQQSHVNLLLTSVTKNHKGVLTGKLFEYIGSLTPTLAVITGGKDSEIENLLIETGAGHVFYESDIESVAFMNWYEAWKNNTPKVNDSAKIQDNYSWDKAVDKILSNLDV